MTPTAPQPSRPKRPAGREHAAPRSSPRASILRLEATNDAGHWTLEPHGEIDLSNASVLAEAIDRVEASAAVKITIDLRQVGFIDLSGVRAILGADRRLKGRLRLLEAPAAVQSVFRVTGTEADLPFETS